MPIYEYECGQCNHHLEALQKLSEEPLIYCPECGEATLRKQVSAAAFRLKGTGWYETDFKSQEKNSKNDSEASEKPQASAGKESDKKTGSSATDGDSSSKAGSSTADAKGETSSKAKAKTDAKGSTKSKGGMPTGSD